LRYFCATPLGGFGPSPCLSVVRSAPLC
jgi:hypothetical protein